MHFQMSALPSASMDGLTAD